MAQSMPEMVPPLSVEEYLRLEATSTVRHEYVAGQLFALAGATNRHNRIVTNLVGHLWNAARGGPCTVLGSDMRLRVADDAYYYPDIQVVCEAADMDDMVMTRPCVVVEVLSPNTEAIDRREKAMSYRRLESLQAYIIVHTDRRRVERHARDEQGVWWHTDLSGEGKVPIPCPQVVLTLAEIYEGTDL